MHPETLSPETAPASAAGPAPDGSRCQHRYPNGVQCRLRGPDLQTGLCPRHLREKFTALLPSTTSDSENLSAELLPELSESSSAVDLRRFLSRLLVLVAQGRVSSQRAAVLSYITSQLLHSAVAKKERQAAPLKSSLSRLARNVAEGARQRSIHRLAPSFEGARVTNHLRSVAALHPQCHNFSLREARNLSSTSPTSRV